MHAYHAQADAPISMIMVSGIQLTWRLAAGFQNVRVACGEQLGNNRTRPSAFLVLELRKENGMILHFAHILAAAACDIGLEARVGLRVGKYASGIRLEGELEGE